MYKTAVNTASSLNPVRYRSEYAAAMRLFQDGTPDAIAAPHESPQTPFFATGPLRSLRSSHG